MLGLNYRSGQFHLLKGDALYMMVVIENGETIFQQTLHNIDVSLSLCGTVFRRVELYQKLVHREVPVLDPIL